MLITTLPGLIIHLCAFDSYAIDFTLARGGDGYKGSRESAIIYTIPIY